VIALGVLGALGEALHMAQIAALALAAFLAWLILSVAVAVALGRWLRRHPPQPRRRRQALLVQVDPGELARALSDDGDTKPHGAITDSESGSGE
jgi:membrane protein implicated in regulation of membrane protease activity